MGPHEPETSQVWDVAERRWPKVGEKIRSEVRSGWVAAVQAERFELRLQPGPALL